MGFLQVDAFLVPGLLLRLRWQESTAAIGVRDCSRSICGQCAGNRAKQAEECVRGGVPMDGLTSVGNEDSPLVTM